MKEETEGLIFAAQEQVLRTNWRRKNIGGQKVSGKCRMCGKRAEKRHDNIAKTEHLELCQKIGLVGKAKWYNHTSARAVQNERVKILWDINIQANHVIQYKRSDIDVM